ncbi:helix-turn-helix transcriptional regulator [Bacteroides sp. 224]|uniref:helix-turn-helix domain-containing protein n=1 Tax=Bacteroides sp. 224 TaxID=2302936 RepID=UPI0013CF4894|nr:helix-turn-helix transcriptional regulator [Bacteroides sp. 224]NDV64014.1 XRE family transcriptional regulator [Bacteroides sp. 224]
MLRQEFCDKCKQLREEVTKVSLNEVWRRSGFQPMQTKRLERGVNNFNMNNAISYLSAIEVQMKLKDSKKNTVVLIKEYKSIVNWLVKYRKLEFTQRSLAENIECSHITIANIESEKSIVSIDIFLRLVYALRFEVELSPNI